MTLDDFNQSLVAAGASLHWLVPFEKRPIANEWAALPNQSVADLRDSYRANANIGIRLGEPSKIADYYLHIIDLDIRDASKAVEAWNTLLAMLPGDRALPSVISGSGGESRHLYFLTDKPFRKKKIAKSSGFTMVMDAARGREVKKNDWEIDLMGTGSQAVIPPSIHPDTRKPYVWERPLDLEWIGMGVAPIVPSSTVADWGVSESTVESDDLDEDDLLAMVIGSPMQLEDGQLDRILADLPADWVDDRDQWLTVGAALHHQFEGKREGFDKWCEWARQSDKFDHKDSARVWKSFKGSKTPVRVATLIQAAAANRLTQELDFDDADDGFDTPPSQLPAVIPSGNDISSLFDDPVPPAPTPKAGPPDGADWKLLLHRSEDGELKTTLHNIKLIVRNDPRTAGVGCYNEFAQDIVLRGTPGRVAKKRDKSKPVVNLDGRIWQVEDPLNGDNWTDTHDDAVRAMIEAPTTQGGYGIKVSDRDLRGAINIVAKDRMFHPIREKLEAFAAQWDGRKRVEYLFRDYFGCADTPYHRQCSSLTILGAVARAFKPGQKFDFVPILEGAQGAGKSTFIKILGLSWSSTLTGDISDPNKMVEGMQGSWIIEIEELSSFQRSDMNDLKAFVSRTHDKTRLAYGKRAVIYPRQCIFIGSTNDPEYLRDPTGNRRFWPIVCDLKGKMIDNIRLKSEVEQIWGEAVHMYMAMRKQMPIGDLPLYITDKDAAAEAKLIQEAKRIETAEDALAGQIQAWLDSPVVEGDGFVEPGTPLPVHNETCLSQIWQEVLGRSGSIPQVEAIKIGKAMNILGWHRSQNRVSTAQVCKKYGTVRVYTRPPAN